MPTGLRTASLALLLVVGAGCDAVDGVTGAREPEAVVRDLPGVAEVERSYDVQEEDFYVNVVTADLEPDVTAEQIADVIEAMQAFREREEPVSLVLYLDEGTADWEPTAAGSGRNGIWGYGDGLTALERAETFLAGAALIEPLDELEGGDPTVALDGDQLRVTVAPEEQGVTYVSPEDKVDPSADADLVTSAAALAVDDERIANHPDVLVVARDFRLTADAGLEDALTRWQKTRAALQPAGGQVWLDSLSLYGADDGRQASPVRSVDACVELPRLAEPPPQRDLSVARLGETLLPVVRDLAEAVEERGTFVELSVRARVAPRSTSCIPMLRYQVGEGPVRPQGLDPAWAEAALAR